MKCVAIISCSESSLFGDGVTLRSGVSVHFSARLIEIVVSIQPIFGRSKKFIRKFPLIQNRLRNLQVIGVDRTVRILSQAEFLCKPMPNREESQAYLDSSEVRRRKTKLENEMRSSNLGTASIALSKYVLGMAYCGVGD